jgi:hypothetical protein
MAMGRRDRVDAESLGRAEMAPARLVEIVYFDVDHVSL